MAVASAGPYAVCTSLQTDNHASTSPLVFLQAGCPSCRPTNSIKALKHCVRVMMQRNKNVLKSDFKRSCVTFDEGISKQNSVTCCILYYCLCFLHYNLPCCIANAHVLLMCHCKDCVHCMAFLQCCCLQCFDAVGWAARRASSL